MWMTHEGYYEFLFMSFRLTNTISSFQALMMDFSTFPL